MAVERRAETRPSRSVGVCEVMTGIAHVSPGDTTRGVTWLPLATSLFSLEIGRHDPPLAEVFRHALVYGKYDLNRELLLNSLFSFSII